jgi:hypothetical protein
MTTSRTTTVRMMAMTARTTGKDDDNSKDDDSEDDGDDGKDDYNDGGNDDSGGGGGGEIGGEVGGVARSVAWLVAVFFAIGCSMHTYRRNRTDMFWDKFILINWSKFYSARPDMTNKIYSICTYSRLILCLFWSKSGSKLFRPILAVTQWVTVKIQSPYIGSESYP